jgi:hypothetical protein
VSLCRAFRPIEEGLRPLARDKPPHQREPSGRRGCCSFTLSKRSSASSTPCSRLMRSASAYEWKQKGIKIKCTVLAGATGMDDGTTALRTNALLCSSVDACA